MITGARRNAALTDPSMEVRATDSLVIRFSPGIADEIRDAIEPLLFRWAHLVPRWCREISVTWRDDDTDGALGVHVHYDYRRAYLNILPNFITCPDRREQNVIHEFMHIVTEPMRNVALDLKNALVEKSPDAKGWAEEAIRFANESVTEDLKYLALDHIQPIDVE